MDITFLSDIGIEFIMPPSDPNSFADNSTNCNPNLLFFNTDDNDCSLSSKKSAGVTSPVSSDVNSTQSTVGRDEDLARIEILVLAVIFCLAIAGNCMVLFALQYRRKKTSRMRYFILHLTIADLLVAFCNILPQLAWDITFRFQGSDAMCRLVAFLQIAVIYASTYILVLISLDRYRAICHPLTFNKWTRKWCRVALAVIWCVSALLASPQLFIFSLTEVSPGVHDCYASFKPAWTLTAYVTMFGVTIYVVPLCLMTYLYGRICYEICKNFFMDKGSYKKNYDFGSTGIVYKFNGTGHISIIGNKSSGQGSHVNSRGDGSHVTSRGDGRHVPSRGDGRHVSLKSISRSKMKTVKLTFVVVIAYLICWSPYIIANMWWAYDAQAPITNGIFVICVLLASLNSCVNPWIYMSFSGNLMRQIIPCFRRKKPRLRERVRSVDDIQHRQDNAAQEKLLEHQPKKHSKNKSQRQQTAANNYSSSNQKRGFFSLKNTLFSKSQPTKLTGTSETVKSRYAVGGGKNVERGDKLFGNGLASPQGEHRPGYLLHGHHDGGNGMYRNTVRNTCV